MNFIDQAKISIYAGNGGDGKVSFRHEKSNSRGGPDGGDGGDGGNVIFEASNNVSSLSYFRYSKTLRAESGQHGSSKRMHGKSGNDLVVKVPVGTEARDEKGIVVADMTEIGQTVVLAVGGKGGFGNSHFVSSRRQAPNFAEKGEPGDSKEITLELKMLADIGLVGLPNAGKSTLIRAISNAKPKVADYPFTTLEPSVGVVDVDQNTSLLVADIPGLIEGAAEGKGLGHDFLRHIERTAIIMHVIDAYDEDVAKSYEIIRKELRAYSTQLIKRSQIVVLNKTESMDEQSKKQLVADLKKVVKPKTTPIVAISAKSKEGIRDLVFIASKTNIRALSVKSKKEKPKIHEYTLNIADSAWQISQIAPDAFRVDGAQIERFAIRTNFSNDQAQARLLDILRKRGVMHALVRANIKPGDVIDIAGKGKITY